MPTIITTCIVISLTAYLFERHVWPFSRTHGRSEGNGHLTLEPPDQVESLHGEEEEEGIFDDPELPEIQLLPNNSNLYTLGTHDGAEPPPSDDDDNDEVDLQEAPLRIINLPQPKPNYKPYWITPASEPGLLGELKVVPPGGGNLSTKFTHPERPFRIRHIPQEIMDIMVDETGLLEDSKARQKQLFAISLVSRDFYPRTRKYLYPKIDVCDRQSDTGDNRLGSLCDIMESNTLLYLGGFASYTTSLTISLSGKFSIIHSANSFHNGKLARLLCQLPVNAPGVNSLSVSVRSCDGVLDWMTTSADFRQSFQDFVLIHKLQSLSLSNFVNVRRDFLAGSTIKTLMLRDFGLQELPLSECSSLPTTVYPKNLQSIEYQESFPLRRYLANRPGNPVTTLMTASSLRCVTTSVYSETGLEELQKVMSEPLVSNVEKLDIRLTCEFCDYITDSFPDVIFLF